MTRAHAEAVHRAARGRPEVAGVGLSHDDRVLFPSARLTKLDLARYYEAIAGRILPHLEGRPLTLVRCPKGTGTSGEKKAPDCYYMRHSKVWAPPTVQRVRIRERTKTGEYLVVNDLAALVGLVQMDVLEIHTWNSTTRDLERPDRLVVDLDPGAAVGWASVVGAAREVRSLLETLGLTSVVKTTGGRGLHVVVPLKPKADWRECLDFARAFATALVAARPAIYTERFAKAGRDDRILVDYLRNNRTNTSIAAYSTRAKPGTPVSVPLTWTELSASRPPDRFTVRTVLDRLRRAGSDPWKGYGDIRQTISGAAVAALRRL